MKKVTLLSVGVLVGLTSLLAGCNGSKEPSESDLKSAWQRLIDDAKNSTEAVSSGAANQPGSTLDSVKKNHDCTTVSSGVYQCDITVTMTKPDGTKDSVTPNPAKKFQKVNDNWVVVAD
jgi:hypothetical protein